MNFDIIKSAYGLAFSTDRPPDCFNPDSNRGPSHFLKIILSAAPLASRFLSGQNRTFCPDPSGSRHTIHPESFRDAKKPNKRSDSRTQLKNEQLVSNFLSLDRNVESNLK
jgi:hypothetical protein